MAEITDPAILSQLNASGGDFLKTLDPARAGMVKALAEGRQGLPAGYSMRSPFGQQLLADVAQYDPTFDAANLPARVAARKAFTSGKQSQNITSFNTAIGHLGTLAQSAEELGNYGSIPLLSTTINSAKNAISAGSGNPEVTNFNVAKQAVVDELERAFKGTGGNVHEIQQWENTLNSSRSPEQLRGAIKQASDLLQSRIGAIQDSYNAAMGTTDQPLPMLNPHAQDALTHFQSDDYLTKGYGAIANAGTDGGTPPPTGPDAAPPGTPPVTPVAPAGGSPTSVPSTIATGSARTELDAAKSAQLEQLIRSGAPIEQIQQLAPGTDPAQVDQVRKYLVKHPDYSGFARVTQEVPNTVLNRVSGSALGAAVAGAGDAATFGTLPKVGAGITAVGSRLAGDNRSIGDIYDSNLGQAEIAKGALAQAHPIATLAGETGGFLLGDAAIGAGAKAALGANRIAAIPGAIRPALGDALYGGAYGAGSSDSLSDIPKNVLTGAALGAGGGLLGRGIVKGTAAALGGVTDAGVRRLTDAGVTLTPGQILGGKVKGIEDRLTGFPGIGDAIQSARRGGHEDFNRAAINDALAPIGETASDIGHTGIADMQQKASNAISNALKPISAAPDAQLGSDISAAQAAASNLSDAHLKDFTKTVDTNVKPYLKNGTITGDDIKAVKEGLDKKIANLRGQGSTPQDRDLADSLDGVKESFLDFADRADPSAASDYAKARQAYALSKRVEAAAASSKDGIFTPNQFRQAVTKRGYGTTTANLARGQAPFQQLATDASTILPSSIPDSGTAGRAALGLIATHGVGSALGGAEGYREGGTAGALTGAVLGAAAFSRPGLKAAQSILAGKRGSKLTTLGDILRANNSLGGAVGTPLLLQNIPQ